MSFYKIDEKQVGLLRSWMTELGQRRGEVFETFLAETTRHEAAYLLEGRDGPILVYAVEVGDLETAYRAFAESQLPVDLKHKRILAATVAGDAQVELLFECP